MTKHEILAKNDMAKQEILAKKEMAGLYHNACQVVEDSESSDSNSQRDEPNQKQWEDGCVKKLGDTDFEALGDSGDIAP